MYRIMLMYYVNPYSFFEAPEKFYFRNNIHYIHQRVTI